jgi:hypothetical protein
MLADMPEERARYLIETLRAHGHKWEADTFVQLREEETRRRETDAIAAGLEQEREQAVASFIRHMESLTGRRVDPAATLNEIVRAARESGGDEIAAWEAISLEPNKEGGHAGRQR